MCGVDKDYVSDVIVAIKALKKGQVDEKLTSQLYYVMKKLEEVVEARPKPVDDSELCPCGCDSNRQQTEDLKE